MTPSQYRRAAELVEMIHENFQGFHPDELGHTATSPEPEVLRRNGTFVVFRKFHTRVAAFRKYLRENTSSPEEEELIAAKVVGRWRSGAPLVLAPDHDDPMPGTDPNRNNAPAIRMTWRV